ncbi:helix-turn-helix domain-containing protein [Chitinophaga lutea]|uniref:Helix-turn-helix domain-containing protein n=1 Tax=Chitinophaga lutea TaxID=2488634 RepID=A0A3N4Q8W7_9BACT|nr:pentapeptide repeat-containing protein [Chitinophaga lutea]RPE08164.1 helix-turn-helix domain-containing protein [Chitinophaga lutea]
MLNAKMIGDKIAAARKKINISQAQLAQRLFISSQAVGKWERGESMPDITTFNSLAEILGVDLNYFSANFPSEVAEAPSVDTQVAKTEALPAAKPEKKRSWNMSGGNWVDADFSGLKNLHEKFSGSNMQRCKFIGSDMSGLLLRGNNIETCDFSGSDFGNSQVQNSNLSGNLFKDCSLKGTEFSGSYITGCDFTGADLTGVVAKSGGFEKCTIAGAVWNSASFDGMYFADMVFEGKVEDCYFENCAFKRVTFQHATLTKTFFKGRSLKSLRFIDCQADRITYEFLKSCKADVTGITLLTQ